MRPLLCLLLPLAVCAKPLSIKLHSPIPADTSGFDMGSAQNPAGSSITVDSRSLLFDGQRWTPAMGEFHYSRYPADEWREELLKMKAGGIDIVATYVFWIHHEEIEGEWDWAGSRDLRRFVETVHDVGLKAIVRCGPWCHGEVRNGGLPDWVVQRGSVRSDDPAYLAAATELYQQIATQLRGLLWKEGGPVIGIQLENEYGGPASHLLTLKRIAREAGLDTPLYTRTGWPALSTPIPFGEILPLYGVYAEGFWDREITPMPGQYWAGFHFSLLRTDANIANEALGRREVQDAPDIARYPYLTCEIGGGMMSSYHRRILVDPRDIESTTIVKLGSGSVSPGYYMYHGGTNPEGRLTTLMEEQATAITNWNDMPVKNYDFQAPLGQYGQVRPHYHSLRRLHYFLRDYGWDLADMPVSLPDQRPSGRDDLATLRWSARTNGDRGFVFINNHERGRTLPPKPDVQFALHRGESGTALVFPAEPITIPEHASAIWPFGVDLGGVTLAYATAQPLTHVVVDNLRTVFFAATPGVPVEFAFDMPATQIETLRGDEVRNGERLVIRRIPPSRDIAMRIKPAGGRTLQIVVLAEADSLALWKGPWLGRNRIFLSRDTLVFDRDRVRLLHSPSPNGAVSVSVYPAPQDTSSVPTPALDGIFTTLPLSHPDHASAACEIALLHPAGLLRKIPLGESSTPVAAAPSDADFSEAAIWQVTLPLDVDLRANPILRLHYRGDVARVHLGDAFIMDDYYNGAPLEIGLARHAAQLRERKITIAVLPLQRDAPIFLPSIAQPDFTKSGAVAELLRAEVLYNPSVELTSP